jgi:hypothetical protein
MCNAERHAARASYKANRKGNQLMNGVYRFNEDGSIDYIENGRLVRDMHISKAKKDRINREIKAARKEQP